MNKIPATGMELEQWMKDHCFNFHNYSVNGNAIHEGYGMERLGGLFVWYYTERGQKGPLKYFQSEQEIVEYAYAQINSDRWAKTHCIGFTTNPNEVKELAEKLHSLQIEFMQDEIPYHGPSRPAYRTFVFGCDYRKVNDLKEKYYKAPQ